MKATELKFDGHTIKFYLKLESLCTYIWVEISHDKAGFIIRNRDARPNVNGANIFWKLEN